MKNGLTASLLLLCFRKCQKFASVGRRETEIKKKEGLSRLKALRDMIVTGRIV